MPYDIFVIQVGENLPYRSFYVMLCQNDNETLDDIADLDAVILLAKSFASHIAIQDGDEFIPGTRFFSNSNTNQRPINPLKDLLAFLEIYRFLRRENIDIVHTHSSKAGILGRLAAKCAGTKAIIHTVHGWPFHEFQPKLAQAFFIWCERLAARISNLLIVVSSHDKQVGLAHKIGAEAQYTLVPYGIDFSQFNRTSLGAKRELGIPVNALVIGTISCFKPQKAPLDFLKVASLIKKVRPEARFYMVGDGVLRKKIEASIKRLKLKDSVILTGWRSDNQRSRLCLLFQGVLQLL